MAKTIECCGQELECDNFTNTCPVCFSDYNWNGSLLAPRQQWGEETGEHWTECVGPFTSDDLEEAGR